MTHTNTKPFSSAPELFFHPLKHRSRWLHFRSPPQPSSEAGEAPPTSAHELDPWVLPALRRLATVQYSDALGFAGAVVPVALIMMLGAAVMILAAAR